MIYSSVCPVINSKIIIDLPTNFTNENFVIVRLMESNLTPKNEKMKLLKQASTDQIFNNDIDEVINSFDK